VYANLHTLRYLLLQPLQFYTGLKNSLKNMELFWSLRVLYMRGKFKKPFAKKKMITLLEEGTNLTL